MVGFLLNDDNVKSMVSNITLISRPATIEHYGGSKKGETESYTEYWDEPLKVSWDSNLTWVYQGEDVSTSNQASYVVDGKVHNVIAPINTMIGDTLILTGTLREHLISDSIKIVLE